LGLACLFIVAIFLGLMVRSGRLALERERAEAAADATAMAAATDYARTLNLISASNKFWFFAEIADKLKEIPQLKAALSWVPKPETVQKIQDYLAGTGQSPGSGQTRLSLALLIEASTLLTAKENGLTVLPLWNGDGDKNLPSPMPTLNLRRRYLSELGDEAVQYKDLEGEVKKEDRFTYREKGSNRTIEVSPEEVRRETYTDKHGRQRTVYRYERRDGKSRFVKREASRQDRAWDIVEVGRHRVTLAGYRATPNGGQDLWVISRAEAGGGSMSVFDADAASFEAYLIPANESPLRFDPGDWSVPKTGFKTADQWAERNVQPVIDKAKAMIPVLPQVLH
jgi:hypothetical protein